MKKETLQFIIHYIDQLLMKVDGLEKFLYLNERKEFNIKKLEKCQEKKKN